MSHCDSCASLQREFEAAKAEIAWLRIKPSPELMAKRMLSLEPARTPEEEAALAAYKRTAEREGA